MNNVAVCSLTCYEARNNESLNQTRTGTIICSSAKKSSVKSLYNALRSNTLNSNTNYEKLKIVGLEKLKDSRQVVAVAAMPLVNIRVLELVVHPTEPVENRIIPKDARKKLYLLLPLVRVLIIDGIDFGGHDGFLSICVKWCEYLKKVG